MNTSTTTATIAVTKMLQLSRSKGWAGCKIDGQSVKVGSTIEAGSTAKVYKVVETGQIRRATRTEKIYEVTELVATGNPADIYDGEVVTITGVTRRPARTVTVERIAEEVADAIEYQLRCELEFTGAYDIRESLKAAGATWLPDHKTWSLQITAGGEQVVETDDIMRLVELAKAAHVDVSLA